MPQEGVRQRLPGLGGEARPPCGEALAMDDSALDFQGGALAFAFSECTTRLESQAFRQPRGGPMEAALILWFLSHQGERNIKSEPQP